MGLRSCCGRPSYWFTFLLVSEDEIDPLVDLARDELRLQGLAVDPDELVRVWGPGRKLYIADVASVLVVTELEAVHVDKHLRQAEELGDQLLKDWTNRVVLIGAQSWGVTIAGAQSEVFILLGAQNKEPL